MDLLDSSNRDGGRGMYRNRSHPRPVKVYLAALFSRREEMEERASELRSLGYVCNAKWVFGGEEGLTRAEIAEVDLEDIRDCDTLVVFTHPRGTPLPGGGRHFETGYAFALGKPVVVVGDREHIFLDHPDVTVYPDWDSLLKDWDWRKK